MMPGPNNVIVSMERREDSKNDVFAPQTKGGDDEGNEEEGREDEGEEEEGEEGGSIAGRKRRLKSSSSLKLFKNQVRMERKHLQSTHNLCSVVCSFLDPFLYGNSS
jgi:hypothetical protein